MAMKPELKRQRTMMTPGGMPGPMGGMGGGGPMGAAPPTGPRPTLSQVAGRDNANAALKAMGWPSYQAIKEKVVKGQVPFEKAVERLSERAKTGDKKARAMLVRLEKDIMDEDLPEPEGMESMNDQRTRNAKGGEYNVPPGNRPPELQ